MPTVGVYVPLRVQRALAERWQLLPDSQESFELVRSLCDRGLGDARRDQPPRAATFSKTVCGPTCTRRVIVVATVEEADEGRDHRQLLGG